MMHKANTISILSKYEDLEQTALKQIAVDGYESPFTSPDNGLYAMCPPGKSYRRFIIDFIMVDYADLEETQVRSKIVDQNYCKTELAPSIEREGLRVPILVTNTPIPSQKKFVTGHHRAWSQNYLGEKIPALVVTDLISLSGEPIDKLADFRSKVASNRSADRIKYGINDAVITIAEAFRIDPAFGGLNPGKQVPEREGVSFDWDDLMDDIYGATGYFLHKGTRTKIRNKYLKGQSAHKIVDMALFSEQSAMLARLGWEQGLSAKGKRVEVLKHYDTSRNAMICLTDSNGRHLWEKMVSYLMEITKKGDFTKTLKNNNIKYIDVACRIYNPPSDKANLDSQRDIEKGIVKDWKAVFASIPHFPLTLRYLVFPKQLRHSSDTDIKYDVRTM
jgi:hypothetical protein